MKFFCAKCDFTAASKPSVDRHFSTDHTTVGKMMKTKTINKIKTFNKRTVKAVTRDKAKPSGPAVTFSATTETIIDKSEWIDIDSENDEEDLNESRLRDIKRQTPGKVLKKTVKEDKTENNSTPKEAWQCDICKIKFPTEDELKEHSEEHRHEKIDEEYICSKCSKKFSDAVECFEHCNSCTNGSSENMVQTPTKEPTPPNASKPTKPEDKSKIYECNKCEKTFKTKAKLVVHNKDHKPIGMIFKCEICNKECKNLMGLNTHTRLKHGEHHKRKINGQSIHKHPSVTISPPSKKSKNTENFEKEPKESDKSEEYKTKIKELEKTIADQANQEQKIKELEETVHTLVSKIEELLNKKGEATTVVEMVDVTEKDKVEEPFQVVKSKKKDKPEQKEESKEKNKGTNFSKIFNCESCTEMCLTSELLKIHMDTKHSEASSKDEMVCHMKCDNGQCETCTKPEEIKCKVCKENLRTLDDLKKHMKAKHPSTKICRNNENCTDTNCRFTHQEKESEEPMDVVQAETVEGESHECNICNLKFNIKSELSSHIKTEHKSYKPCSFFPTNSCTEGEHCRYSHKILGENEHICFKCGKIETTKTLLIRHIRETHKDIQCRRFKSGTCRFNEASCIYSHKKTSEARPNAHQVPPMTEQDFPQAWQAKPPDNTDLVTKVVMSVMKEMMPLIIDQVKQSLSNQK